ncbi:MAG: barstar family protein [Rhizobiales bacterium]|nr:barstar family protein [Hyphomicrobiales bacterium]
MRRIALDARTWHSTDDLYSALLLALGAPGWHGRNLDALWDSLTEGAAGRPDPDAPRPINRVQPPFHVVVSHADAAPEAVRNLLARIGGLFAEARAEHAIDVTLTF